MNKTVTISENQWEVATNHAFELSELREKYKARGKAIKELEHDNCTLLEEVDSLAFTILERNTEISELKQELEQLNANYGELHNDWEIKKKELERVTDEMFKLRKDKDELTGRLERYKALYNDLHDNYERFGWEELPDYIDDLLKQFEEGK